MTSAISPWVEDAAALPLAFAQVREDPLLDLQVVDKLPDHARLIMVASGGCTAALLATSPKISRLHLVDPNPAQLALTRLKLRLLQSAPPATRLAVLGHAPMSAADRRSLLETELSSLNLPANALGPTAFVAAHGPDQSGRYERLFAALRHALRNDEQELDELLRLGDPEEQRRRIAPSTALGRQLDRALDEVFSLPILVRLFGEQATQNPAEPFSRHFARRIRSAFETFPAHENPYLWQMLKGTYPAGNYAPWLSGPMPARIPQITWSNKPMIESLEGERESCDFVHLSNILDWLSPERARATLKLAWQALRPGGWVLIRQLNSTLDIPASGEMFHWHSEESKELLDRDRSFFYRGLYLGSKR